MKVWMRQPWGHNESVPHIHVSETLFNRYNADTSTGLYSFPQCTAFSPFINRKHQKIRPKDVDILTVQNGHIYTGHPRGAFTLFAPFNRIQWVTPFIDEGFDNALLSSKASLSECRGSKFDSLKEHKIVSLCMTFCSASLENSVTKESSFLRGERKDSTSIRFPLGTMPTGSPCRAWV